MDAPGLNRYCNECDGNDRAERADCDPYPPASSRDYRTRGTFRPLGWTAARGTRTPGLVQRRKLSAPR